MHKWEVPDVTRYFIWLSMVKDFIQKLIQRTAKGIFFFCSNCVHCVYRTSLDYPQ